MDAYRFFSIYQSVKLHFTTTKYDAVKYGFKNTIPREKFEIRKDKDRFTYFSSKITDTKDAGLICISNFVYNNSDFIYNHNVDAFNILSSWKINRKSIHSKFKDDIIFLKGIADKLHITFDELRNKTPKGFNPVLFQSYKAGSILPETMVILDNEYGYISQWDKLLEGDYLWDDSSLLLTKYKPFVNYRIDEVRNILNEEV